MSSKQIRVGVIGNYHDFFRQPLTHLTQMELAFRHYVGLTTGALSGLIALNNFLHR